MGEYRNTPPDATSFRIKKEKPGVEAKDQRSEYRSRLEALGKRLAVLVAIGTFAPGAAEAKEVGNVDRDDVSAAQSEHRQPGPIAEAVHDLLHPPPTPKEMRELSYVTIHSPEGDRKVPVAEFMKLHQEDSHGTLQTFLDVSQSPVTVDSFQQVSGDPSELDALVQNMMDRVDKADILSGTDSAKTFLPAMERGVEDQSFEEFQRQKFSDLALALSANATSDSEEKDATNQKTILENEAMRDLVARQVLFSGLRAEAPGERILTLHQAVEALDAYASSPRVEDVAGVERLQELSQQEIRYEIQTEMQHIAHYPFFYNVDDAALRERLHDPSDRGQEYLQVRAELYETTMQSIEHDLTADEINKTLSGWLALAKTTRSEAMLLLDSERVRVIAEHGSGDDPIQDAAAAVLEHQGADFSQTAETGKSRVSSIPQVGIFDAMVAEGLYDEQVTSNMFDGLLGADASYQVSMSPELRAKAFWLQSYFETRDRDDVQAALSRVVQGEAIKTAPPSLSKQEQKLLERGFGFVQVGNEERTVDEMVVVLLQFRADVEREDRFERRLELALTSPTAETTVLPVVKELRSVEAQIIKLGPVLSMPGMELTTAGKRMKEQSLRDGVLTDAEWQQLQSETKLDREGMKMSGTEQEQLEKLNTLNARRILLQEHIEEMVDPILLQEIRSTDAFIQTYGPRTN